MDLAHYICDQVDIGLVGLEDRLEGAYKKYQLVIGIMFEYLHVVYNLRNVTALGFYEALVICVEIR